MNRIITIKSIIDKTTIAAHCRLSESRNELIDDYVENSAPTIIHM